MPAWCAAWRAANRTLSATSCRKAVLSDAASSKVSGGTRRVLARPGAEAFAMKAMPHEAAIVEVTVRCAPIEPDLPLKDLPLNRSVRFMRCPLTDPATQQGWHAKLAGTARSTSGSPPTSRQTPKSYPLHQVVIARSRSPTGERDANAVVVRERRR